MRSTAWSRHRGPLLCVAEASSTQHSPSTLFRRARRSSEAARRGFGPKTGRCVSKQQWATCDWAESVQTLADADAPTADRRAGVCLRRRQLYDSECTPSPCIWPAGGGRGRGGMPRAVAGERPANASQRQHPLRPGGRCGGACLSDWRALAYVIEPDSPVFESPTAALSTPDTNCCALCCKSCPPFRLPHLHVSGLSASSRAASSARGLQQSPASACCGAGCTRPSGAQPSSLAPAPTWSAAAILAPSAWAPFAAPVRSRCCDTCCDHRPPAVNRGDRFPPYAQARRPFTPVIGPLRDPRRLHPHQTSSARGLLHTSSLSFRTWRAFTVAMASSMLQSP